MQPPEVDRITGNRGISGKNISLNVYEEDIELHNQTYSAAKQVSETPRAWNYTIETWISVGGWAFTDAGSTQTAWSNMVSSAANRAAFISSLEQFMITYGFDGVDLDWENPGASDRGGSSEDGANSVLLVKQMRSAFGTKYGISPVEMESYVDWFNLMAYDLHGTGDVTDTWTGP
ncbi:glycoside hydrolase family 18 protein [Aspergillus aculeatus ATCC 16872]|uniref:Glycoside hydrolase family 18 protein n=1 Tax=Aspergillus aculeatus (strain ATCC 16872 / CBS 172.66 / WB 5094) TaxID=690307 RepID=A0A1L9WX78_ASPA1|nr:glycoside hydrolase family 18 protein [Aspergillus aculeatus ATCC 16872]OJK00810.1 glycoside hydrolase family 18 protein [Aspergillus aculeatus ATCC 16872]